MKWKVINDNHYENIKDDLLTTLMNNREVYDIDALLHVGKHNINRWSDLNNIYEAIEMYRDHIDKGSHIHIRIDPDCDGSTSFTYLYNYTLKNFGVKCTYNTASGKQHGINVKELKKLEYFDDIDLFIFPDGGTYDYKAQEELTKLGKNVIIFDHHSPEEGEIFKETEAIVINPQLDNYPNKTLSGVGVIHKVCEGFDELCGFNDSKHYLDLVALGCVADNMDLRDLETRYYVLEGIKQLQNDQDRKQNDLSIIGNEFIQEIIKSKEEGRIKRINITSIGWEIAPLLNGMARAGKEEEKMDMFKALIGEKGDRYYQPRRKHKEDDKPEKVIETLQQNMVRTCTSVKGRQDRSKAKSVEIMEKKIIEKNLNNNKILIVDGTGILDSTQTGLVANGLANKYKKPCIILKKREDLENVYGGSGRNCNMSPIIDLKKFMSNCGHFNYIKGHNSAFGISIKTEELFKINDTLEEMLKDVTMEDTFLVDYEIPIGRLLKEQIIEVGKLEDIWGNTLQEPTFALTNIKLNVSDIQLMGQKRNIVKFKKNDISFIKFYANEDVLNDMKMKSKVGFGKSPKDVVMDIIGTFNINEWMDKLYPQITIVSYNVRRQDEILF